jgi:Protein of unknown function (DUF3085)
MAKLIFKAEDVRRIVEHTIASKQSEMAKWETANEKNGWTPERVIPTEPQVILVHDDGVYLMSNGTPRDLIDPNSTEKYARSFVAYAEGCNPTTDDDFYDNARDLVGGDDFSEYFPWAKPIKEMLDNGATKIVVDLKNDSASVTAVFPKGKKQYRSLQKVGA